MQNVIIKGFDNPVTFVFSFTGQMAALGLNNFTNITIDVGSESYSFSDAVEVLDKNTLALNIGSITNLADNSYYPEIVGLSPSFPNGFLISGSKKRVLSGSISVVSQ